MVKGSWTSLMLVAAVVCSPMAQARFLSPDPKLPIAGNIFGFNRYAYANNNPVTNLDPDGRDCTTANRVTTCSTVMYRVQFPAQPGFKDFTTSSPNYHFYSVPVDTPGHTVTEDQNYLVQRPTPGSSNGASPQGTPNDATPVIGNTLPGSISPVMSFTMTNQKDGQPVIVNVTEPGHPLQSGIVVREATQSSDGSTSIQTWGEGTAPLQSPSTWEGREFGPTINNVWKQEAPPPPPPTPTPTGCGTGAISVCN